jgi:hypothetical protein
MANLRYMLDFELHHVLDGEDDAGTVVTVQKWAAVNSARARVQHVVLEDGKEVQRNVYTDQRDIDRLAARLASLCQRVGAVDDGKARQLIKARTGVDHPLHCYHSSQCSYPRPIGSDRCLGGHSAGQVGGGAIGSLMRGNKVIMMRRASGGEGQ